MFLLHTTGSSYPVCKSIQVEFIDDEEYGTIASHTCSKLISFPRNVFHSYEVFCTTLGSVLGSNSSFNTV